MWAGTEAEAREKHCARFATLLKLSYLSNTAQVHKLRVGTNYSGLGPPTSVSNQGNDLKYDNRPI